MFAGDRAWKWESYKRAARALAAGARVPGHLSNGAGGGSPAAKAAGFRTVRIPSPGNSTPTPAQACRSSLPGLPDCATRAQVHADVINTHRERRAMTAHRNRPND